MSLKAQLEVLIHMESFRNINIYHQGIYVMRARIYQKLEDGTVINAHPYRIVEFDQSQVREKMKQKYRLSSDLYDHYFFSKAFMIKYMDEMVDLDDICHFRAEIDSYPHYNEDNFFFTVDLMFADLSQTTSENVSLNDPDKAGFKVVATFESLLHNSFKGNWSTQAFANMCQSILMICIIPRLILQYTLPQLVISKLLSNTIKYIIPFTSKDYQFRYLPPKINENEKHKKGQQIAPLPENFEQFYGIITQNCKIRFKCKYRQYKFLNKSVTPNLVDEIYNTYVGSLRFDHKKFLKHFKELAQRMIKNEQKLSELLQQISDPPVPEYLKGLMLNLSQNQLNNSAMEKRVDDSMSSDRIYSEVVKSFDDDELEENKDDETTVPQDESETNIQMTTLNKDKQLNNTDNQLNDNLQEKKLYYSSYYDVTRIPISKIFNLTTQENRKNFVNEIQKEINTLAGCQFLLWNQYVELLRLNTIKFTKLLLDEYQLKISDQWGQSIFRYPVVVKELFNYTESKTGKAHQKQAKKYRKTTCFKNREPLNVEDLNLFPKAKVHPIIFHEVYTTTENINIDAPQIDPLKRDYSNLTFYFINSEAHVIVLVHGFQGSSYDLRLFSNNITIKHPDAIFLHSSCNEENTDGDISTMGVKLADEVKKFLTSQLYGRKLKRLSFVGHSLGGLIMRAALPYLEYVSDYFFTFLTFSSPHMGFLFSQSKMVDAGLWFMKAWNKSQSLKQMTLADNKNIKETFVYQLAFNSSLIKFKHIILCSSPQDQYVPYHSARMQQTNKQSGDSKNIKNFYDTLNRTSALYNQMLQQIFSNISVDKIHRVDVSFEIPGKMVDNFIGRAAHIQFLENEALMKMVLSDFKYIFV